MMTTDDHILVVTDAPADARLIKQLLDDDFSNVAISTVASQAVADFIAHQPGILVLGFDTVRKAEDYYLGLHRQLPLANSCPHRAVVLCNKDTVQRAYELCKKGQFDDYVIFWPLSFDAPRLHMAIHGALRELHHAVTKAQRADELLVHTHLSAQLQPRLSEHATQGRACMDIAEETLLETRLHALAALDSFSKKLAGHNPPVSGGSTDQALELEARFTSAAGAIQSVRRWSETLEDTLAPQIESARAMKAIADNYPQRILVVEDDVFQHKVLDLVLGKLGAELTFAASGAEAFSMLRKSSPNLILMDLQLPDMDGVLVIRNIKAVDRYSAIPIIMITGRRDKNTVLECKAAGAADFVGKPFEPDTMLTKVRHWLQVAAPALTPRQI